MTLDTLLDEFPKTIILKDDFVCKIRPLESSDEPALAEFILAVPETERMFIKHRVSDPDVIRGWCQKIDYGRNLPLLAFSNGRLIGDATLHQQLGGWKRHIARVSVLVHPEYRGRGIARALITELIHVARHLGLARLEAEFIGGQEAAIKMFALLGFVELVRLPDYVRDMQAIAHDYILMALELTTDEEYAGMG